MKHKQERADDAARTTSEGEAQGASKSAESAGESGAPGPAAEREELADALAEAVRARDDYLQRWQRAQADFQNLRRRTQADIDAAVRRSQQGLLEGMLLAIDQLELALAAPGADASAPWTRGVQMTKAELLRALANAGAQPMGAVQPGARFDPAQHQAVATAPSREHAAGSIVEVVRGGYTWGDVVLRPAQVIVAAAPAGPAEGKDEERA